MLAILVTCMSNLARACRVSLCLKLCRLVTEFILDLDRRLSVDVFGHFSTSLSIVVYKVSRT